MPLIWEGVSPGKPGKYSQTPRSGEACNGHEGVVKYSTDETTSTPTSQRRRLNTSLVCRGGFTQGSGSATPASIICLPQPCIKPGICRPSYFSHFQIDLIYAPSTQDLNSSTSTPITASPPPAPQLFVLLQSPPCPDAPLPWNMPTTDSWLKYFSSGSRKYQPKFLHGYAEAVSSGFASSCAQSRVWCWWGIFLLC